MRYIILVAFGLGMGMMTFANAEEKTFGLRELLKVWTSGVSAPEIKDHRHRYSQGTRDLHGLVISAAEQFGLPAARLAALIRVESGGNPCAVSHMGAMGLTQLMPGTASDLGVSDPFDPEQNILGGAQYLAALGNRFETRIALAGYNWGPARAGRTPPNRWPSETRQYVASVLAWENKFVGDRWKRYLPSTVLGGRAHCITEGDK